MDTPTRAISQSTWVDIEGLDLTPVQPLSEAEENEEEIQNQSEICYSCTQRQSSGSDRESDISDIEYSCTQRQDLSEEFEYSCTQRQESSEEFYLSMTPRQDNSDDLHAYSATQLQESTCGCENDNDSQLNGNSKSPA